MLIRIKSIFGLSPLVRKTLLILEHLKIFIILFNESLEESMRSQLKDHERRDYEGNFGRNVFKCVLISLLRSALIRKVLCKNTEYQKNSCKIYFIKTLFGDIVFLKGNDQISIESNSCCLKIFGQTDNHFRRMPENDNFSNFFYASRCNSHKC